MEARRRSVIVALCALCLPLRAAAIPLEQAIPSLFGGRLATSISPRDVADAQHPHVIDDFRQLASALSLVHSQLPVPSTPGSFSFVLEREYDAFVRVPLSFGPTLAERAQTLGRGHWTLGVSYSHIDFDTFEGTSLSHLHSTQPALTEAFLQQLPAADRARARDDTLTVNLDTAFQLDQLFLSAALGVTDSIDVSLALSVARAHLRTRAQAVIGDPASNGGAFFSAAQPGVVIGGNGECSGDFHCARDAFDETASGTGDVLLRGKWHILDTVLADLGAVALLTVPTGNADDLLGFHDPTLQLTFVASKSIDRFVPHVNLGYALRSRSDVSQAQWIVGSDVRVTSWLTLAGDFLGFHDDWRDGINDDAVQSALSFAVNPIDQVIVGGNLQFPLNRDGVRADIIYSGRVEYAF